jgi:hypothetical protein
MDEKTCATCDHLGHMLFTAGKPELWCCCPWNLSVTKTEPDRAACECWEAREE